MNNKVSYAFFCVLSVGVSLLYTALEGCLSAYLPYLEIIYLAKGNLVVSFIIANRPKLNHFLVITLIRAGRGEVFTETFVKFIR